MRLLVADAVSEAYSGGEANDASGGDVHLPGNQEKRIDALKARLRQKIRHIRRTLERRDNRLPEPGRASK